MSTLHTIRKESFTYKDRRYSADNVLSTPNRSPRGSFRNGKVKERAAIPVFDAADVSPLKQLQRIKESGAYQTLPRKTSSKAKTSPISASSVQINVSHSDGELSKGVGSCDVDKQPSEEVNTEDTMGNIINRKNSMKISDTNGNLKDNVTVLQPEKCNDSNANHSSNPREEITDNYYKTLYMPKPAVLDINRPETIRRKIPQLPSSKNPPSCPPPPPPQGSNPPITVTTTSTSKPLVEVKLIKRERRRSSQNSRVHSKSAEDLDKSCSYEDPAEVHALSKEKTVQYLQHTGGYIKPKDCVRDSFMVSDNRESIYHSVGDVQTLLKTNASEEERIYSLPQPACYGDDTMKAVKKITEKYDTLQRRKVRALSFRETSRPSLGSGGSVGGSQSTSPGVSPLNLSLVRTEEVNEDDLDAVFTETDVVCVTSGITQRDVSRLDLFYRGHGTEVTVCQCLADLAEGSPSAADENSTVWEPVKHTGVPVLIFNTGEGKRHRELYIALAERETGFPLWKDRINYLSNYGEESQTVHRMHMSNNLRKILGLRFYCASAAGEFFSKFKEITQNPNDDLWKISGTKEKKEKRSFFSKKLKAKKQPSKREISQPCNFSHITKVNPRDLQDKLCDSVNTAASPLRSPPQSPEESRFRPRLSTT